MRKARFARPGESSVVAGDGIKRRRRGARARARDNEDSDRIGGRPEGYHQKVDLAFRQIAAEEPGRVRIVDASGSPEASASGAFLLAWSERSAAPLALFPQTGGVIR